MLRGTQLRSWGTTSRKTARQAFLAAAVAGVTILGAVGTARAVVTWAPPAGSDLSWGTTTNWSGGILPTNSDDVLFNIGTSVASLTITPTVTNILSSSTTVDSLVYNLNGGGGNLTYYHAMQIDPGATLTITGAASNGRDSLWVGENGNNGRNSSNPSAAVNESVYITGGGSLVMNTSGNLRVANDRTNNNDTVNIMLDMSGLQSFNATVGNVYLDLKNDGSEETTYSRVSATLALPALPTSTATITANLLKIGTRNSKAQKIILGTSNTLNIDTINFGAAGSSSDNPGTTTVNVNTATTANHIVIRARDGFSPANVNINHGTTDFTTRVNAGAIDMLVGTLKIGTNNTVTSASTFTNSSTFNFGNATEGSGPGTSILNGNAVTVGANTGTSTNTANSYFNINGGRLSFSGSLTAGGGGWNGNVTVNNASLTVGGGMQLGGNGVANGSGVSINAGAGTLTLNPDALVSVTGNITLGGTAAVSGTNTGTYGGGKIVMNGGSLSITGGNILSTGGAASPNTITLAGGTLNMGGGSIGAADSPVTSLLYNGGSLTNVGSIYAASFGGTAVSSLNLGSGKLALTNPSATTYAASGISLITGSGGSVKLDQTGSGDVLNLAGLTLNNSVLNFDFGNGTADQILLSGASTLSLAGTTQINITEVGSPGAGSFPLLTFNGTPTFVDNPSNLLGHFQLNAPVSDVFTYAIEAGPTSLNLVITTLNQWTGASSSSWDNSGNWSNGVPNAPGAVAPFINGAMQSTIAIDSAATVGTLIMESSTPYTITGPGSLTFAQSTTDGLTLLNISGANQTIAAPMILQNPLVATIKSTLTLSGPVTGSATFTLAGTGTLRLADANVFQNAALVLSAGTLDVNGLNANIGSLSGAKGIDIKGTTLTVGSLGLDSTYAGAISNSTGSGTLVKIGSGTLTLTGTNTFAGGLQLQGGKIAIAGDSALGAPAAPVTFTGNGGLRANASLAFNATRSLIIASGATGTVDTNGFTVTVPGPVQNAGTFIKTGNGVLALTGTNTYAGATIVTGGALQAAEGVGLPTTSLLVLNGGAYATNGTISRALGSAPGNVQIGTGTSGFSAIGGPVTVNINGGSTLMWNSTSFAPTTLVLNDVSATDPMTVQNSINFNGAAAEIQVGANVTTVNGLVSDTSGVPLSFTKSGSGTLVLTSLSYAGAVSITGGVVRLPDAAVLPGTLTLGGGTLDMTDRTNLSVGGLAGSSNLDLKSAVLEVGSNNTNTTYSGSLLGSGQLTKVGTGSLILGAATSTFTGSAIVKNGTLKLRDAVSATPSNSQLGSGVITLDGGTLNLNGSTETTTPTYGNFSNALVVNTTGTLYGTCRANITGTLTGSGTLNYIARYLRGGITGNWSSFAGTLNVTASSADTSNKSEFRLSNSGLPLARVSLGDNVALTGGTVSGGATLTASFGELTGTYSSQIGNPDDDKAGTMTITVGALNTDATFNGTIVDSGGGRTNIVKTGTGSWTLGGYNTYTGTTTLNAGKLIAYNSQPFGTGTLTVNAGTIDINGYYIYTGALAGTGGFITNSQPFFVALTTVPAAASTAAYTGVIEDGAGTVALIVQGSGVTNLGGANTYSGGTSLYMGTLGISSVANIGSGPLYFAGGNLRINGTTLKNLDSASVNWSSFYGGFDIDDAANAFTVSQNITTAGAFNKTGKGTLILSGTNSISSPTVGGGTLVIASSSAQPSGQIYLETTGSGTSTYAGRVVIKGDAANLATYRAGLAAMYNSGYWNGYFDKFYSLAATVNYTLYSIGYMSGQDFLTLDPTGSGYAGGYTVEPTDVLVRLTYAGDADLDGKITLSDYAQLDAAFLFHTANPAWKNGDFNYDGVIDYNDYVRIDAAFAAQSGALAADMIASHTALFGEPYTIALDNALASLPSAVPEPASLALLAIGGLGLLRRRR